MKTETKSVGAEECPLLEDCNQAMPSEDRRLACVIVIVECKCPINPIIYPNLVYGH
jgi:hypothetical protein